MLEKWRDAAVTRGKQTGVCRHMLSERAVCAGRDCNFTCWINAFSVKPLCVRPYRGWFRKNAVVGDTTVSNFYKTASMEHWLSNVFHSGNVGRVQHKLKEITKSYRLVAGASSFPLVALWFLSWCSILWFSGNPVMIDVWWTGGILDVQGMQSPRTSVWFNILIVCMFFMI